MGGQGTDTYRFSGACGKDSILDSDGKGTIEVNGVALQAGKKVSDTLWVSEDKKWRYALQDNGDLVISKDGSLDNTITVRNWKENGGAKLGIDLQDGLEAAALKPQTTFSMATKEGRQAYASSPPTGSANLLIQDAATAINVAEVYYLNEAPILRSTGISLGAGNDIIEGGAAHAVSNSLYFSGAGDDAIYGGSRATLDQAIARGDSTSIAASTANFYVEDGGAGKRQFIGSDASDVLVGLLAVVVDAAFERLQWRLTRHVGG